MQEYLEIVLIILNQFIFRKNQSKDQVVSFSINLIKNKSILKTIRAPSIMKTKHKNYLRTKKIIFDRLLSFLFKIKMNSCWTLNKCMYN